MADDTEERALADPSIERARQAADIETPDPEHSLHVAWLSLRLFDQLAEPLELAPRGRDLLAAAALWHDAGQVYDLEEHHRHSYDVIMSHALAGFSPEERLAIANIARYHRRAEPSLEHPSYGSLPRALRPTVDAMAALLRIAEGLDASHLQIVRDVACEVHPRYVTIRAICSTYPMLEIERAQERAGLFKRTFYRDVDIVAEIQRD